jgi:hypothetical protein
MDDLTQLIDQAAGLDNVVLFKHLLQLYKGDPINYLKYTLTTRDQFNNPERIQYNCLKYLLEILRGFYAFIWATNFPQDIYKYIFEYWKSDIKYTKHNTIHQLMLSKDLELLKKIMIYTRFKLINILTYKNQYNGRPSDCSNVLLYMCTQKKYKNIYRFLKPHIDMNKSYSYSLKADCNIAEKSDTIENMRKIQRLFEKIKKIHDNWIYMTDCFDCFKKDTYEEIHKSLFLLEIYRVHFYKHYYLKPID